ncbi:MAG: alkyl hydroperoxide reductase [Pseudomonadota bacterium]
MDKVEAERLILKLAAVYNLLWGAFIILFPFVLFDWAGLDRPSYPEIWKCVGMIVGVYGVGYWFASFDPYRHWIIVLVGFLGKILGPIGFVQSYIDGVFNLKFGTTILFNDLIWWGPFAYILWNSWRYHQFTKESYA